MHTQLYKARKKERYSQVNISFLRRVVWKMKVRTINFLFGRSCRMHKFPGQGRNQTQATAMTMWNPEPLSHQGIPNY